MATANLEVLICGLLPLLVHGVRCGLGEHASCSKDDQAGEDADEDTESNLLALIWGSLSTGAMRAEGDPVGCEVFWLALVNHACDDARYNARIESGHRQRPIEVN